MKFKSHQARKRYALSKAFGTAKGEEPWSNKEIAEELGVSEQTVRNYLNSAYGREVYETLDKVIEETRLAQIQELNERLDTLSYLEEELMKSVEVIVTDYNFHYILSDLAQVDYADGSSYKVTEAGEVSLPIPVPNELAQVPQFERLQKVWKEQRLTYELLNDLLGLRSPEQIELSGTQERKVWVGLEEDTLPPAKVSKMGEEEEE